jgi:ribulose-phosphate 3-epimerase
MLEILPGILEKDWNEVEKKIEAYKPFAKSIHIDLLDGRFASNVSFLDPKPFRKYSNDFLLELHMMVEDPVRYLKPFAAAGFGRFIGQVERMPDQVEFVAQAQLLGEVGLGIDVDTPVEAIGVPLDDLDSILVMTVKAGFSGQEFLEKNLEKVKALSAKTAIPIEIDGGMNEVTAKSCLSAGARRFVATSFLFGEDKTPREQYVKLKEVLSSLNV